MQEDWLVCHSLTCTVTLLILAGSFLPFTTLVCFPSSDISYTMSIFMSLFLALSPQRTAYLRSP